MKKQSGLLFERGAMDSTTFLLSFASAKLPGPRSNILRSWRGKEPNKLSLLICFGFAKLMCCLFGCDSFLLEFTMLFGRISTAPRQYYIIHNCIVYVLTKTDISLPADLNAGLRKMFSSRVECRLTVISVALMA